MRTEIAATVTNSAGMPVGRGLYDDASPANKVCYLL